MIWPIVGLTLVFVAGVIVGEVHARWPRRVIEVPDNPRMRDIRPAPDEPTVAPRSPN